MAARDLVGVECIMLTVISTKVLQAILANLKIVVYLVIDIKIYF